MTHLHTPLTAATGGQPIHSMLAQFPTVCFTLTLLTDVVYWRTSYLMWQEFSSWLLLAGLVSGALALVAGVIDLLFGSAVHAPKPAWPHAIGGVVVLALAFLNSLAHARDGWIAVVPWGLILSVATIIAMVISNWLGRAPVFHYGVGARRHD
ncbi:DUF2231 domain-containing protein [Bradyrhizobium tunisiense]|uniref:DUF2231 domain-containing protein n=1 Tax=Bradyrhizobium tunisiense TaxID=3278709 RepID=UPI0035DD8FED